MSVQKRSTKRGTVYDVRLRDPATGREVSRTFTTRRDATTWEAEQRTAKARGAWIDPRAGARTTVAEVAEEWLRSPGKRASSVTRDEIALRRHVLPTLGRRPVGSIARADLQRLVSQWGDMAPSTVHRTFSTLRAVVNYAVDRELLLRSPTIGVRLPTVEAIERRIPTPEDVAALAETVGPDYEPMVWIGAVLGLRWGEVAGLRVGRLDFLRSTLLVAEQLTRGEAGRMVSSEPKSAAGRRTVTVPGWLMGRLGEHLARRGLTGADTDAFVFVTATGQPVRYSNWRRRVWNPAAAAVGLGNVTQNGGRQRYDGIGFHDLRRANATALVAEGVDIKTAQTRLGHSNPRLTLAIYAQATSEGDRAAAERLGAYFEPTRRPARLEGTGD